MSTTTAQPAIGFIGLGDQGLPMATALAEAGYPLHVWARRPGSLAALGTVAHVRHDDSNDLAAWCDIVVVVNHGTGTPRNAVRLTQTCARAGVDVLDAPVSGGRPAAQVRTLTTMVGGPQPVAQRCEPLFGLISRHVVYLGGPGSGQTAKLFNNALLMMNQANIADIVELAATLRMDLYPRRCSGTLFPDTVGECWARLQAAAASAPKCETRVLA